MQLKENLNFLPPISSSSMFRVCIKLLTRFVVRQIMSVLSLNLNKIFTKIGATIFLQNTVQLIDSNCLLQDGFLVLVYQLLKHF